MGKGKVKAHGAVEPLHAVPEARSRHPDRGGLPGLANESMDTRCAALLRYGVHVAAAQNGEKQVITK